MSSTSDKIGIAAGDAVPLDIAPVEGEAKAVKARGYWELVWSRFKRDRLALLSVGFIFFLLFGSFILAPIMTHILGHGPNDIFADGVDPKSLAPVGPWTWISTAPYPGASGHFGQTLLPLGADGALGRDLFLRLLYGAQTSLEVALLATFGSVGLGVLMGLAAGYFGGWVDTVVSRLIEIVMVFPFLLFIIADPRRGREHAEPDHVRLPGSRRVHVGADLLGLRVVLPCPHHPRRRPVAAREGVRRSGTHDGSQRLPHHAVASAAASGGADHRLLDADHRARTSSPRRGSRSSGSASNNPPRAGATSWRPLPTTTSLSRG